jgi:hypothetical protein
MYSPSHLYLLQAHRIGWTISGAFALVDTIFALVLIWLHLRNYNRPEFQRYYVRIIFMIPVYSVVSWYIFVRGELKRGWVIDFTEHRRITSLDEMHTRPLLFVAS